MGTDLLLHGGGHLLEAVHLILRRLLPATRRLGCRLSCLQEHRTRVKIRVWVVSSQQPTENMQMPLCGCSWVIVTYGTAQNPKGDQYFHEK